MLLTNAHQKYKKVGDSLFVPLGFLMTKLNYFLKFRVYAFLKDKKI